jgi:hypothetical protein
VQFPFFASFSSPNAAKLKIDDQPLLLDFSQVVTLEQNWNLGYIDQPDSSGEGWDQWWLPFGMLRPAGSTPGPCAYAPCNSYYDNSDNDS